MSALIVEMLEAAFGGDQERALRLAEEAGVSRFDLAMLRRNVVLAGDDDEPYVDHNLLASAEAEGYEAGYRKAVDYLRDHDYAEQADLLDKWGQPEAKAS